MNTSKRLILYTRVSTGKQCASLETQTEALRAYCKAFGHVVVGEFTDTQSGKSDSDRRGLQAAYRLLASPDVDGMVVYKLDRLGRNLREATASLEDRFKKPGKALHLLDMQIDTSSPMGKAFFGIAAVFAELARDQIIERTVDGLRHRKENGKVYCRRLYGTTGQKTEDRVESPEDQAVIRKIVAMREQKRTYEYIADELNLLDIPPPNPTHNGKKCRWHKGSVQRIFLRATSPQGVEQ